MVCARVKYSKALGVMPASISEGKGEAGTGARKGIPLRDIEL